MAIVTLADAKAQLNIPADDTSDDAELLGYVAAAAAAVEKETGRVVERRVFTDQVPVGRPCRTILLPHVPVAELISLTSVDGYAWDVSAGAVVLDADSGAVTLLTGPPFSGTVVAVVEAGPAVVAPNDRLAGLIIIQHLWQTQRGTMGIQLGGDSESGYVPGRGFAIPRRAQELLANPLPGVA
ncbi:phage head-tail connector protein [Streptomyces griseoluteus]|uniref:phage head-tail connector protein n=1 Tax=Streptomyces griseoluteus TaxID=29306 RepID=UPI00380F5750